MEKYVHLEHHFEKADWDEAAQKWVVTVKKLRTGEVSIIEISGDRLSLTHR